MIGSEEIVIKSKGLAQWQKLKRFETSGERVLNNGADQDSFG